MSTRLALQAARLRARRSDREDHLRHRSARGCDPAWISVRDDLSSPGRISTAEWTLKRKDGVFDIPVETSAHILPDGRWQAFVRDIRKRQQDQERLRQSETHYRGLIEQMPDGVFAYRGGRIVYANRAFAEILGYADPTALVGNPVGKLLHPDDRQAVSKRIRRVAGTGLPAPPKKKFRCSVATDLCGASKQSDFACRSRARRASSSSSETSLNANGRIRNSRTPTHSSTQSSKTFPSCCSSRRARPCDSSG